MDEMPVSDLMRSIMQKSRRYGEKNLKSLEVNPQQGRMITYIAEHQEHDLIQKDLAKAFDRRGASITSMLQGLEKKGYIKRTVPADNERQKVIHLLPKGQQLVDDLNASFQLMEDELLAGLETNEQAELIRLLRKVDQHL